MTSPEQPAEANQLLSERRARAVQQALVDALGPELRAEVISVIGVGERLALESGLMNPEATGLSRKKFRDRFPEDVKQWPKWRTTDVLIDDRIVLKVQANDEETATP